MDAGPAPSEIEYAIAALATIPVGRRVAQLTAPTHHFLAAMVALPGGSEPSDTGADDILEELPALDRLLDRLDRYSRTALSDDEVAEVRGAMVAEFRRLAGSVAGGPRRHVSTWALLHVCGTLDGFLADALSAALHGLEPDTLAAMSPAVGSDTDGRPPPPEKVKASILRHFSHEDIVRRLRYLERRLGWDLECAVASWEGMPPLLVEARSVPAGLEALEELYRARDRALSGVPTRLDLSPDAFLELIRRGVGMICAVAELALVRSGLALDLQRPQLERVARRGAGASPRKPAGQ